jgi:hypothetical protein
MAYTPNPDRAIKGGKAMVSAQELADFREKFGKDKSLRDLLNMDKGLDRKLVIPKSMRNLPSTDSDSNAPISIPKSMRNLSGMAGREGFDEAGNEMKRGGAVKKMASGGSASSRADGCAVKGKTKGRMV